MSEITWEKNEQTASVARSFLNSRARYLVIGVILLVGVVYLVVSGTATGRYYITIDELLTDASKIDKNVRIAGAVDGSTIHFDPQTQILTFTVVNIPDDSEVLKEEGGLAQVLHNALEDPNATRLDIVWQNAEVPDLLQHEAQAIMSGKLDENGKFHANEVIFKCPTRYSDDVPEQVAGS